MKLMWVGPDVSLRLTPLLPLQCGSSVCVSAFCCHLWRKQIPARSASIAKLKPQGPHENSFEIYQLGTSQQTASVKRGAPTALGSQEWKICLRRAAVTTMQLVAPSN